MSSDITATPASLAHALEANGPGAHLSRRAWQLLASLCRAVDPTTADVDISHTALAVRLICSPKTVGRALGELVAAGLIHYSPGGRVGRGSTAVRLSYVRVWVEMFGPLLEDGRELVRMTRDQAAAATRARMRALLDYRARRRSTAVDNFAALLDVGRPERKSPGQSVIDKKSTYPPGPSPDPGGWGAYVVQTWGKARKTN